MHILNLEFGEPKISKLPNSTFYDFGFNAPSVNTKNDRIVAFTCIHGTLTDINLIPTIHHQWLLVRIAKGIIPLDKIVFARDLEPDAGEADNENVPSADTLKSLVDLDNSMVWFDVREYKQLTAQWIVKNIDGDNEVGLLALFLYGNLVAKLHKAYRKDRYNAAWVSRDSYNYLRNFLKPIVEEEPDLQLIEDWDVLIKL